MALIARVVVAYHRFVVLPLAMVLIVVMSWQYFYDDAPAWLLPLVAIDAACVVSIVVFCCRLGGQETQ